MWVAKVLMNGDSAAGGETCKKFGIDALVYPISSHVKEDGLYLYFSALLISDDLERKQKFFKFFSKHKRIIHLEKKDDLLIGMLKESLAVKDLYGYNIIHVRPILIRKDGYEIWTIGSWEKRDILQFINVVDERFGAKLLQMKKQKLSSVTIMHTHPALTDKQRVALRLAVEHGYYNYPRKTDLENLAKRMGCSYSTFQAHLRKAEREIMPFAFREDF